MTLTRERPPDGWKGFDRRTDAPMLAAAGVAPEMDPDVYVCGPTPMVDAVANALVGLGHEPARIRTERFGPQERDEMSAEVERSTLDGNAAGGLLREVFAFDATVAPTICPGCGRIRPMAELMLYAVELGAILRCPSCEEAVVRIGRTPRGLWLDLRGTRTVVAADPATP